MNDEVILGHLLEIEAEADSLVNDAQAEADKRIAEGERQSRAVYEEQYQKGAAFHEAAFRGKIEEARESCRRELSAYRESLDAIAADTDRFCAVLESLFAGGSVNG